MIDHHDEAEAYRNRAERAEQFAGELQAKIDALQQHAEVMAEELEGAAWLTEHEFPELSAALRRATANWTAWLIDNPLA